MPSRTTSRPVTLTCRDVGVSKPELQPIVVVFPAPRGEGDAVYRRQLAIRFAKLLDFDHETLFILTTSLDGP